MPTWNEFITHFGTKELVITVLTFIVIILAREEKRIFRRKKDDPSQK